MICSKCSVCGGPEIRLSHDEAELIDFISDMLSEIAGKDGTAGFTPFELDFICGQVCDQCALEYFAKKFHLD